MTRCHGEATGGCLGERRCLTHALWDALGAHISSFLSGITLQDVLDGIASEPRQPTVHPALELPAE
jgi:DNA-binding IscR family transcriptional regulator